MVLLSDDNYNTPVEQWKYWLRRPLPWAATVNARVKK